MQELRAVKMAQPVRPIIPLLLEPGVGSWGSMEFLWLSQLRSPEAAESCADLSALLAHDWCPEEGPSAAALRLLYAQVVMLLPLLPPPSASNSSRPSMRPLRYSVSESE
jgi:hypothetical protein